MENHFTQRPLRSALLASIVTAVMITLLLAGNLLALQDFTSDTLFAPQLSLNKQVDRPQAEPGDTLAYTIAVDNTGTSLGNVVLTDTLPAGLTLQPGSVISNSQQSIIQDVLIAGNYISMSAVVGSNGMVSLQFDAVVDGGLPLGTVITNTAWLTGEGSLLTDTAVTLLTDIIDLSLDKTVDSSAAEPGSALGYTVLITNNSTELSDFADVLVTDTLPAPLLLQANTLMTTTNAAVINSVMLNNNTIALDGTLAGGGWISLQFDASIPATVTLGTTVTNSVLANSAGNFWSASASTLITNVVPITSYFYLPVIRKPVPTPVAQVTAPTVNNEWTVSWNIPSGNVTGFELQEAYDASFTINLQTYSLGSSVTSRQFQYPSPPSGAFYYRVRALVGGVASPWSNIVSVTVFPELTLTATRPDSDNEWQVSWTGGNSSVSYYELQEATNVDFTENLKSYNTGTSTSKDIAHIRTADNLYYYRVRSFVGTAASSWSDVIVVVGAYKDTFLSDQTNWEMRRTDASNYNSFYRSDANHYQIELDDTNDYLIASPLGLAPDSNYEIEFEGRIVDPEDRHMLGIVFGGDWNGNACPDSNNQNCFNSYYLLRVQYRESGNDTFLEFKLKYIESHDSNNQPIGPTLIDWVKADAADPDGWNVWRVEVESDGDIKISLGDTRLASVRDNDLDQRLDVYFGFLAQTKDEGTLKVRFDDIAFEYK